MVPLNSISCCPTLSRLPKAVGKLSDERLYKKPVIHAILIPSRAYLNLGEPNGGFGYFALWIIGVAALVGTLRQARHLGEALVDIGAPAGWIVDQGEGEEVLNASVRRRGFATDVDWLPT